MRRNVGSFPLSGKERRCSSEHRTNTSSLTADRLGHMRSLSWFSGRRARRSGDLLLVVVLAILPPAFTATARAQSSNATSARPASWQSTSRSDSSFAAVQARGADRRGMGVDQYTSSHHFDALPDGGRIELQRTVRDAAGVAAIRRHLREIASAFAAGDFRTPGFVHMQHVPGTSVMAAKHGAITYVEHDLPHGGEVRITTHDPQALTAVHDFIAFQQRDHRASRVDAPHPVSSGQRGGHQHPPG